MKISYKLFLILIYGSFIFITNCDSDLQNGFERIIVIEGLNCSNRTVNGPIIAGSAAIGVKVLIPFSKTNGGDFPKYSIASTGVTGLVATLVEGKFPAGSGFLTFNITGIAANIGAANFEINFARARCTFQLNVLPPVGTLTSLNCSSAAHSGVLFSGVLSNGVSSSVSYSGGNGGTYNSQAIASTGVTGLTANLTEGILTKGSGNLIFTINGVPSGAGTANFLLNIGGRSCTLTREVFLPPGSISSLNCSNALSSGILVSGVAASGVSSTVAYSGGNGGTYNGQNIASTGVTGLTASIGAGVFANGSGILTYSITGIPSGYGTASFNINIGGRQCILTRDVSLPIGTISSLNCAGASNVGSLVSGISASGVSASVSYSGGNGGTHNGQSVNSTGVSGLTANLGVGTFASGNGILMYSITGTPSGAGTASFSLSIGGQQCVLSRTVASPVGSIGSLNCMGASNTGSLVSGVAANGVSSTVFYSGGNGGIHNGQNINSTGVTGLVASLNGGNFAIGSGNLVYSITGIPSGSGTANFALNIGGRQCVLSRTVSLPVGSISSLNCIGATNLGNLVSRISASGVSSTISYSGGNGGSYNAQTVSSTGVTGLTARLNEGTFANGSGSLIYSITGTPSGSGIANFNINVGGRNCTLLRTVSSGTVSITLKTIPAGTFSMGCTAGDNSCNNEERPIRNVTLSAFQISETEITIAQWESVMGFSPISNTCSSCPVEAISWFDAVVFCNRLSEIRGLQPCYYSDANYSQVYGKNGSSWNLPNGGSVFRNLSAKGYRLPTEAEWEYAARGGNYSNIYSGSSTIENVAWYSANSGKKSQPVRQRAANGFGLFDMSGNVWEWCQDWFGTYPSFPQVNPTGPATASNRVIRGGSWDNDAWICRVSFRFIALPNGRYGALGFRVAL